MSDFGCDINIAGDNRRVPQPSVPATASVSFHNGDVDAWGIIRDEYEWPVVWHTARHVAFGDARLQNRAAVLAWLRPDHAAHDIALIAMAWLRHGRDGLRRCHGDYALVLWDSAVRQATLIRDAMGLRPLYYARERGGLRVASRAARLAASDDYDLSFIADYLVTGANLESRTVFRDVSAVPPGSVLTVSANGESRSEYWSPYDFGPGSDCSVSDAVEQFGALFREAVRADLTPSPATWSALSGGLDSSSIVSQAAVLARETDASCALGGTISVYDTIGKADERQYSDTVVAAYGVRNVQVQSGWPWEGFDAPVLSDQPTGAFVVQHMHRHIASVVRDGGGRVYLHGLGADHYLNHNLLYIADLVARGRVRRAWHDIVQIALARKASVWRTAYREVVRPSLPARLAARHTSATGVVPPWIPPAVVRQFDIDTRMSNIRHAQAPWGHKFSHSIAYGLRHVTNQLHPNEFDDALTLRYPFFYQPLLEYALCLPPHLRFAPTISKYILRESMRGILPEAVRTRPSKGATGTRLTWALRYEQDMIQRLLHDPILAAIGFVDAKILRRQCHRAFRGRGQLTLRLYGTLTLETWLQVRAGRWSDANATRSVASGAIPVALSA